MRHRTLILFLVLAAVWGTAYVGIKAGLAYFPPVLYAALRYDIAGLLMLGYAVYTTDPIPHTRNEWTLVLICAVFLFAAHFSLLFIGQQNKAVTSATAAVTISLVPVFTTAIAAVLYPSERLGPVSLAGILVCLLGVALLTELDPSNLVSAAFASNLLIFGAAFAFALGSVLTLRIEATLPIPTLNAWSMLGGALFMHSVSLSLGESATTVQLTIEAIVALGYIALFSSLIGFLIYFDLLERIGPIEINLVSYVAPVFAAIAGLLFLGEPITPATVGGFLVILVGFVLIKHEAILQSVSSFRGTTVPQSKD